MLNNEDKEEIRDFISCVFKHWYGLQAAISNGMGGSPREASMKVAEMTELVFSLCCSDIDKEAISDTLEDTMDSYFNTWLEDGSLEEVASEIYNHMCNWLSGNKDSIRSFVASKSKSSVPICPKIIAESDDDEADDDTRPSTSTSADNIVDSTEKMETEEVDDSADGWEIPKYARRKNR